MPPLSSKTFFHLPHFYKSITTQTNALSLKKTLVLFGMLDYSNVCKADRTNRKRCICIFIYSLLSYLRLYLAMGLTNLTLSTDWVVEYINCSLILLAELHIILGHQISFGDRKKIVFVRVLITSTLSVRTKIR